MIRYKGYEIKPMPAGGYTWRDTRNFVHWQEGVSETPFPTVSAAKESIDAVMRAMAPDRP